MMRLEVSGCLESSESLKVPQVDQWTEQVYSLFTLTYAGNSPAAMVVTETPAPALKKFTISEADVSHKMITNDRSTGEILTPTPNSAVSARKTLI